MCNLSWKTQCFLLALFQVFQLIPIAVKSPMEQPAIINISLDRMAINHQKIEAQSRASSILFSILFSACEKSSQTRFFFFLRAATASDGSLSRHAEFSLWRSIHVFSYCLNPPQSLSSEKVLLRQKTSRDTRVLLFGVEGGASSVVDDALLRTGVRITDTVGAEDVKCAKDSHDPVLSSYTRTSTSLGKGRKSQSSSSLLLQRKNSQKLVCLLDVSNPFVIRILLSELLLTKVSTSLALKEAILIVVLFPSSEWGANKQLSP